MEAMDAESLHGVQLRGDQVDGLCLDAECEEHLDASEEAEVEEAEAAATETETKKKKSGKRRKKKKQEDELAASQANGDDENAAAPAPTATQKCTAFCGKRKLLSEFNKDQTKCKDCYNHTRAFWRHAEKQGCKQEMLTMEKEDPALAKDVQKGFVKERARAAQNEGKINFSIQTFKKSLQSRSGDRREDEKVMMWQGQWFEEAKKAEHGFLTREEAELKWAGWIADDTVRKDDSGPRGYQRVAVPTRTVLTAFDEVAHQKELSQAERLSRSAKPEVLRARAALVLSETAVGEGEAIGGLNVEEVRRQARATGVDMTEMMAPNLRDAADAAAKRKSRGRKEKEQEEKKESEEASESSDKESARDPNDKNEGKAGKGKKDKKWFDAETKCRKAERTWISSVEVLEASVKSLAGECANILQEFRDNGDSADFQEEMNILDRRQKWLQAVLDCDDRVSALIEEQTKEEKQALEDQRTTSQDVTALSRIGPCRNYRELKTTSALKKLGAEYRTCTSNQAIKDANENNGEQKKVVLTLVAAVKAAKSDLQAAKKRKEAARKKEEEKAAKAAKAEKAAATGNSSTIGKRKAAQAKGEPQPAAAAASKSTQARKRVTTQGILLDSGSQLWQGERYQIPTLSGDVSMGSFDVDKPFVVSGVALPEHARQCLQKFAQVFSNSALRVTEGRAQTPLPSGVAAVEKALHDKKHLPSHWHLQFGEAADPSAGPVPSSLASVLKASTFGIAGLSISNARTELAMLPCVRIFEQGNLVLAVHTPQEFGTSDRMTTAMHVMNSGSEQDLAKMGEEKELFLATVGPGDLVYFPAASVVSHKAHAADVLGLRMPVLARDFRSRMVDLYKVCSKALPNAMNQAIMDAVQETDKTYMSLTRARMLGGSAQEPLVGAAASSDAENPPAEQKTHTPAEMLGAGHDGEASEHNKEEKPQGTSGVDCPKAGSAKEATDKTEAKDFPGIAEIEPSHEKPTTAAESQDQEMENAAREKPEPPAQVQQAAPTEQLERRSSEKEANETRETQEEANAVAPLNKNAEPEPTKTNAAQAAKAKEEKDAKEAAAQAAKAKDKEEKDAKEAAAQAAKAAKAKDKEEKDAKEAAAQAAKAAKAKDKEEKDAKEAAKYKRPASAAAKAEAKKKQKR